MNDREKLLTALLSETDPGAGREVSVYVVIAMLNALGAEHERSTQHELALTAV